VTTPTLLSIQVGLPKTHGADRISKRQWISGIFKSPVEGRIWLDALNLRGDGQEDLDNHGGPFRAVLSYAAAHYPVWRGELGMPELPYGAFGENFTVSDLDEETVSIGDVFDVGEARIQVSQPRMPCWKLARRWQMKDLTARVDEKGWGGWYARVVQEGYVEAGEPLTLIERPFPQFKISTVNRLITGRLIDPELAGALADCAALTPSWRGWFAERAEEALE
jgi:MOSC domain-containing protein YiiM